MTQAQNENAVTPVFTHSFYAVRHATGKFFAGFNAVENKASTVEDPNTAKWFSNRFEIPLRPAETLVEIKVDPTKGVVSVSEPFRPKKRVKTSDSR